MIWSCASSARRLWTRSPPHVCVPQRRGDRRNPRTLRAGRRQQYSLAWWRCPKRPTNIARPTITSNTRSIWSNSYESSMNREHHSDRRGFGIGVAGFPEGHPATPNRLLEMDYLKQKVDAGADYIVTQLFFDNRDFLDFRDRCELAGINVPIVAGIMPITSIGWDETHGRTGCRCALSGKASTRLATLPGRSGKRRARWHSPCFRAMS